MDETPCYIYHSQQHPNLMVVVYITGFAMLGLGLNGFQSPTTTNWHFNPNHNCEASVRNCTPPAARLGTRSSTDDGAAETPHTRPVTSLPSTARHELLILTLHRKPLLNTHVGDTHDIKLSAFSPPQPILLTLLVALILPLLTPALPQPLFHWLSLRANHNYACCNQNGLDNFSRPWLLYQHHLYVVCLTN